MIDKTVGFIAILRANLVAEEGVEADLGQNIEFFTKNVVEELETGLLNADHEVFFGAIAATVDSFDPVAASGDAD